MGRRSIKFRMPRSCFCFGKDPKNLPSSIELEDLVHRIIFDKGLPYEPCKLYTEWPIIPPKPSELKTLPLKVKNLGIHKGFQQKDIDNSLFWSMVSIYAVYGCKMPSTAPPPTPRSTPCKRCASKTRRCSYSMTVAVTDIWSRVRQPNC